MNDYGRTVGTVLNIERGQTSRLLLRGSKKRMMDTTTTLQPKVSKACNDCKARKVRCISEYLSHNSATRCVAGFQQLTSVPRGKRRTASAYLSELFGRLLSANTPRCGLISVLISAKEERIAVPLRAQ